MKKLVFALCSVLLLSGCASSFSQFYEGYSKEEAAAQPGVTLCENPKVIRVSPDDFYEAGIKLLEDSYGILGESNWNGPDNEGNAEALAQAKKLGACYVLWTSNYTDTRSGTLSLPQYNPGSTSTSSYSGTVYSGGSSGTYSGTATTYSPGYTTYSNMPYSVRRLDYTALFYAKSTSGLVGVFEKAVPLETAKKMGTNAGFQVLAVVKNTPAYKAAILREDIILSVNGQPVYFEQEWPQFKRNSENIFKIYRDGQIIFINVYIE